MNKERELEYAAKYKRTSYKIGIGLMIAIIIMGIALIAVGIFLIIYDQSTQIILISVIMFIMSIFDIILAIKFYFYNKRRIAKMKDKEAAYRYCKIHGYRE